MIKAQCLGFLNTPPLWRGNQFDIQQFNFPDLKLNTIQPEALPQNLRLGHQVEHIFKQLIEQSNSYNILVYNLPIRHEKRTLGEIDFILQDNINNKLIHVELTYKFYIIDTDITDPIQRLIGPNRRDTFFLKKEKIKNIQFPLLHAHEGIEALAKLGIDHKAIEHQCCFKAQLFIPYGQKTTQIEPFNKDCITGLWLRFDDFDNPEFQKAQFYIPTKSEWIIEPHDEVSWQSHQESITDIRQRLVRGHAPMVWCKAQKNSIKKIFILHT